MAHPAQQAFCQSIRDANPERFANVSVLDVGSLDVNGNNRHLFDGGTYLGLDRVPGPNVDHVGDIMALAKTFDLVISTEALEHDPHWRTTFVAMCIMAQKSLLVTCAGPGRPEHGTRRMPKANMVCDQDYYRNIAPSELADIARVHGFTTIDARFNPQACDTYLWATR